MSSQKFERCITILADGARLDVMQDLIKRGELPNISEYLVAPGTLARAVTTFPSTTGPAYFPFINGYHPGTLNVPGIRWFDKQAFAVTGSKRRKYRSYVGIETFMINHDVEVASPSIFEILPHSYSIFNSVCRGVGSRNLTKIMRIWYWYYAHLTDHWDFLDTAGTKKALQALQKDFQYIFLVMPGIDEFSHLAEPHHDQTIQSYRVLDQAVGKMVKELKSLGKWDGTLMWIVSDHGLSKTDHHFCLNNFLEERDLPPFYYPKVFHRAGKKVANMMSGNSMTHLYFRNGKGWEEQVTRSVMEKINSHILSDLVAHPAIELLACRNETGGIDVLTKNGEGSVKLINGNVAYYVKQGDPFGYGGLAGELSAEECLKRTYDSTFPDGPWQLAQLFKATRTGDVVLSATPGYDLREEYEVPEHKGSHGSLNWQHMQVPVVTNAKMNTDLMRTLDVFPTTLQLLNQDLPDTLDGISRL